MPICGPLDFRLSSAIGRTIDPILHMDVNISFAMTTYILANLAADFDVGVLFYNRARQTLDCVLSFLQEEIQPNIVIFDQGSATEQRTFLHEGLSGHANVRFVGSPKNIGVAAGRNRLCEACSAEWILFVDNDMALNTRGGVSLISSAVEAADGIDAFSPKILNIHENRFRIGCNSHCKRDAWTSPRQLRMPQQPTR